ncbi:MAG: hypothetical protein WCA40_01160, partial [Candidatus Acidiferrum sp.]
LNDDPLALLGEGIWKTMLDVAEVYEQEKKDCERLRAEAKWTSPALAGAVAGLTCLECGSDLLKAVPGSFGEITFECVACGEEESPESYVPRALAAALQGEAYIAMTDGGDPPYVNCPECGEDAYLLDEDRCALCGESVERSCRVCGNRIPVEELDSSPLCGYCQYIMNKDD